MREWRLHALSIFSLAVAFVCLGAALLVVTNLVAAEQRWAHAGRASVYLKDAAHEEDVEALKAALAQVPGVTGVRYVSSGDARAEFGRELDGRSELAGLPVEAFPASIELDIAQEMPDADLADMVAKMKGLARLVRGGVTASAILALVVFAAVLAVIGSTMRLVLQRRSTEVQVLKLVGATDAFVKKPFVVEGSVQGALGALGAIALLGLLFLVVRGRLDSELAALVGVEPSFLPWPVALAMVVLGAILGAAAAFASLRKMVAI
jgi:cell division transport system permease protein